MVPRIWKATPLAHLPNELHRPILLESHHLYSEPRINWAASLLCCFLLGSHHLYSEPRMRGNASLLCCFLLESHLLPSSSLYDVFPAAQEHLASLGCKVALGRRPCNNANAPSWAKDRRRLHAWTLYIHSPNPSLLRCRNPHSAKGCVYLGMKIATSPMLSARILTDSS